MDMYKIALSALLLAPVAGGVGIHMLQNYQEMKQQAETIVISANEQMESVEKLLEDELTWEENELETEPEIEIQTEASDDVTSSVIRFHVRANSDSEEDQALKLLVRDGILELLNPKLELAENKDEARAIMEKNLAEIEEAGEAIVQKEGYEYEVHAYLTTEEFPMKSYGDLIFPAGEYEALRVDIGKKEGANWWCVMYPGLCFVDATGGVVASDGKEALEHMLTPEEYRELLLYPDDTVQVEYRSLLWDWLGR